ncbi:hypothetical protein [Streptomyces sp. NPDC006997]|uniref:hypothetical protein n=1 Tax=Streptomyces sp. NPDC006997 TaxID=3155356 RepID=UPI0033CAFDE3
MNATMVFVHGRGQEFKDPEKLRATWLKALASGLNRTAAPVSTLQASLTVLPFYGNVLYRITSELARDPLELESMPGDPDEPGPLHPYLPEDVGAMEQQLMADMVDMAEGPESSVTDLEGLGVLGQAGRSALSWSVTRRSLIALSRHTRLDQEFITEYLRDVAVYLARARDEVLAVVRAALPSGGPLVVVSHSLGTVVACDLLADSVARDRVSLWVTAGSPLGLEAVQRNLRPRGPRPMHLPWLTAYDPQDVVSLGHPLGKAWGGVENVRVDNSGLPHAIDRYLAHPPVAQRVAAALTAS